MSGRMLNKLSAITVARTITPGRHSDGGGLYLYIGSNGRRRWIFMYARRGKRVELGLGSARDVPLAMARSTAATLRTVLAAGGDPKAQRVKAKGVPTFGECADVYIEAMKSSWRNQKHAEQWTATLKTHAAPLRSLAVDEVTTEKIVEVLTPLWTRTPETAERLRGRIEKILSAAKAKGYRSGENPAAWRGHLDQLLPRRQRLTRGHHAALPYAKAPGFLADLRQREATASLALEFTILTAARSGEVLGMKWEEVDLESKRWVIPAERMKAMREHRVPLPPRAIEILEDRSKVSDTGLVFFGLNPDKPLSSMAMAMLLRRMKLDVTVHGFRSTFRDWASETTGFPHEVCEMALAHTIANKAEAAYRRGDLFEKRRELMTAWEAYLLGGEPGASAEAQ